MSRRETNTAIAQSISGQWSPVVMLLQRWALLGGSGFIVLLLWQWISGNNGWLGWGLALLWLIVSPLLVLMTAVRLEFIPDNNFYAIYGLRGHLLRYVAPRTTVLLLPWQDARPYWTDESIRLDFEELTVIKTDEGRTFTLEGFVVFRYDPCRAHPSNWPQLLLENNEAKLRENAVPMLVNAIQFVIEGVPDHYVTSPRVRRRVSTAIEGCFLEVLTQAEQPAKQHGIFGVFGRSIPVQSTPADVLYDSAPMIPPDIVDAAPGHRRGNRIGLVFDDISLTNTFTDRISRAIDNELAARYDGQARSYEPRAILGLAGETDPDLDDVLKAGTVGRGRPRIHIRASSSSKKSQDTLPDSRRSRLPAPKRTDRTDRADKDAHYRDPADLLDDED
jgi:hypothetical protein